MMMVLHLPPPKKKFCPLSPNFGQNLEMAVKCGYSDYCGKRQPFQNLRLGETEKNKLVTEVG